MNQNEFNAYIFLMAKSYERFVNHMYYDPVFVKLRFMCLQMKYLFLLRFNLLLDVPEEYKDEKNKI